MAPKEPPEPPEPPAVLTEQQIKIYTIVSGVACCSLIIITVMTIMILTERELGSTVDYPIKMLRNTMMKITRDREELAEGTAMMVAEGTENLTEEFRATSEDYERRKRIYRNLFEKTTKRRSGPWKVHGKGLYFFANEPKTWYDAENFCLSRDAHLASVLSEEEQDYITSQIEGPSWIGLADENREGVWEWSDGSNIQKMYWSDAELGKMQRAGELDHDCTFILPSTTKQNWNNDDCYKLYGWVCKDNLDLK